MPAALTPEVRERLRKALREQIIPKFARGETNPKRVQSKVARAMGVSASSINRLLIHGSGGSLDMVFKAAKVMDVPPEQILFGEGSSPGKAAGLTRNKTSRPLKEVPGFDEALDEAIRLVRYEHPHISADDLRRVGSLETAPPLDRVIPSVLISLASSVRR